MGCRCRRNESRRKEDYYVPSSNGVSVTFLHLITGLCVFMYDFYIVKFIFSYGNKGSPPSIPGNSTLVFEVELKSVQ